MKKSLLLLASMLMSAASFAQWNQPVPSFVPMAEDGQTVQYLYNVEAKGFLVGANDWNTRVSISTTEGWKVKVAKEYEDPEAEVLVPTGFYTMVDSVQNGNNAGKWLNIWASAFNSIYTDYNNNEGASILWTIKPLGDAYQLYCEDILNGSLGVAELFEGKKGNTRTWLFDPTITYTYVGEDEEEHTDPSMGGTFYDKWAFVSEEEYAAWAEKAAVYNAAMALGKTLETIPKGFDAAKWQGVFNNTNSSLEDLQNANVELTEAILDFNSKQATVDNPGDMTSKIVNPNFDGIKFDGWEGSGFGAGGTTAECAERYNMTYDTYQIIEGIPNGIYKVLVNGFYRAGGIADDWTSKDDASQRLAKVYAVSGEDSLYNSLPSLSSGATNEITTGSTTDGGLHVPNSMAEFVQWEDAGFYNDNSVVIAVENHTLKIGVRKDTKIGDTDWTIVDTWRLLFYGDDIKAYKMMFDDAKNAINKDMQSIIVDGVSYDRTARQDYMDFLAKAEAASTKEELKQYTQEITGIASKVLTSIPVYKQLKAEYDKIIEALDNNTDLGGLIEYFNDAMREDGSEADLENLFEQMKDYEGGDKITMIDKTPLQVLEEGCYTTEEVNAYTESLIEINKFCIANSLVAGQDCTKMLTNADFSNGFTGWTKPGAGNVGNFSSLTPAIPNNVEVYENQVDIYQIVKGAQPGIYSISCKAFERPAANGSYDGSEPAKVFLYMNDFKTPVQNICKDAISEENAKDGENCYISQSYASGAGHNLLDYLTEFGYVPNGMVGAAVAFNAGRYEQKVYGIVEKGQDMKIGLTSNGATAHWVLWADFRLTYEGISDEAVDALAELYSTTAEEYMDNNSESMSQPAVEKLNAAIEAVNDAEDAQAKYDAIIALNKVVNVEAPANVEAYNAFNEAIDQLNSAMEYYAASASEEAISNAEDLIDTDASGMNTEDIIAVTAKIKEAVADLKIPAKPASDEDPVDYTSFIVNADVEEGATVGWTYTKNGGNGPALNSGIGGTPSIEFWNGSASSLQFDVNQTITLPAGTYELTADASNSLNGQDTNGEEGRAYLYALVKNDLKASASTPVNVVEGGCTDEYSNYSIIFTLKEKGDVTIGFKTVGTMEARWFVCDNFTLTCYGENSAKTPNSDEGAVNISDLNTAKTPAAIYSISGAKLNSLKKGINIVKGADGSVRKIFVK